MLPEIGLFVLGGLFSIWWFTVTLLPLFYGLPKAIYWCARGLFRWRVLFYYLIPPLLWNIAFTVAVVILMERSPATLQRLLQSGGFNGGQLLGLLGCFLHTLRKEGRSHLRKDFVEACTRHLATEDPMLLAEFAIRNRTHNSEKPE